VVVLLNQAESLVVKVIWVDPVQVKVACKPFLTIDLLTSLFTNENIRPVSSGAYVFIGSAKK
jgi:hypothetical protein